MTQTIASTSDYAARIAKVRAAMVSKQVDAALLSVGHDLPYLSGYFAMPLERLTMLVIPQSGEVTMVVPRLEVARVTPQPGVFSITAWGNRKSCGNCCQVAGWCKVDCGWRSNVGQIFS